jgi:hypothetical protein
MGKVKATKGTVDPLGLPPALQDFRGFLWMVWKHLGLPEPTPVQLDMADWIANGPRRRMAEAFRGVGKSWMTVAYVAWRLRMDPQTKIMVVSASGQLADDFCTFLLQLIHEVPLLAPLIPREDQRSSRVKFDVGPAEASKDPSVKSVGINGQMTGSRADLIIADDVEIPNNSDTQLMRDKLAERVKEFDAILKPNGEVLYLGTPQTEESLYNRLPDRGYQIRVWPAEVPEGDWRSTYGDRLAPMVVDLLNRGLPPGKPMDPQRFTEYDLAERKASYGRSGYARQYMLDTRLSDALKYPLKVHDFVVLPLDPMVTPERVLWNALDYLHDLPNVALSGDRWVKGSPLGAYLPYVSTVMAVDPSGRGGDETGYAVLSMLNGNLFVRAWGAVPGGYSQETLGKLAAIAKDTGVRLIVAESNFGDGMFTELFKPVLAQVCPGIGIEEVRSSRQKEARIIDTLEPLLNQHRLIIDPQVILDDYRSVDSRSPDVAPQYRGLFQLTRITKDRGSLRWDDRIDALAIAAAYWVDSMALDAQVEAQARQQAELDLELERYDNGIFGRLLGSAGGSRGLPGGARQALRG